MAQHLTATMLLFAVAGGFLPSLFWLWFWLKEDRHPEPRWILMSVFIGGMITVPIAVVFEYLIMTYSGLSSGVIILAWAFIEEILKYASVKKFALSKSTFDEPMDAVIYMITAALGFASVENTLFMLKSFHESGVVSGLSIGNIRFVGATLLHIASSAIIGSAIAFSFRKNKIIKKEYVVFGVFLAGLLHFAFNYFIINSGGSDILIKIFIPLWILIIAIIFIFEKVKKIN